MRNEGNIVGQSVCLYNIYVFVLVCQYIMIEGKRAIQWGGGVKVLERSEIFIFEHTCAYASLSACLSVCL